MAIRNLKDSSKNPWLCECYPQGREGKRIRKRFSTKGEAIAFERFTMREIEDKPLLCNFYLKYTQTKLPPPPLFPHSRNFRNHR